MHCVGCSGHYTDHKCHTTNLDTIMVKESTVHCTLGRETQHFSFWLCVLKREHCEVESGFVDVVDVSAEQTAVTCVCVGGGDLDVLSCLVLAYLLTFVIYQEVIILSILYSVFIVL